VFLVEAVPFETLIDRDSSSQSGLGNRQLVIEPSTTRYDRSPVCSSTRAWMMNGLGVE
jgi:hypothetical protein